jgi:hypothetical protein
MRKTNDIHCINILDKNTQYTIYTTIALNSQIGKCMYVQKRMANNGEVPTISTD